MDVNGITGGESRHGGTEPGYGEWLSGKVGRTMERVASGAAALRGHEESLAALGKRLGARFGRDRKDRGR